MGDVEVRRMGEPTVCHFLGVGGPAPDALSMSTLRNCAAVAVLEAGRRRRDPFLDIGRDSNGGPSSWQSTGRRRESATLDLKNVGRRKACSSCGVCVVRRTCPCTILHTLHVLKDNAECSPSLVNKTATKADAKDAMARLRQPPRRCQHRNAKHSLWTQLYRSSVSSSQEEAYYDRLCLSHCLWRRSLCRFGRFRSASKQEGSWDRVVHGDK